MNPSHQSVKERYLLQLWTDYVQSDRLHQLDRYLAQAMRQIKSAGKRDRMWYGDHIFAMSRFSWLALFLESLPEREAPTVEGLHRHLAQWQPPRTTSQARHALLRLSPTALWNITRHRLQFGQSSSAHEPPVWMKLLAEVAAEGDCLPARMLWAGLSPLWLPAIETRARQQHWSHATLLQFIDAHVTRPPLYIRPMPEHLQEVEADLNANRLETKVIGNALSVTGSKGVFELDTYKQGWFEIQDLASQAIGEHVAAKPGDLGWDACAGGGGKSLQLAASMRGKGAVYASDIRQHKLDEVKRRAQRGQLYNIRTFVWQGDALDRLPQAVQKRGGFDWVLVDAPCTSSGTWRRNPDARWRCDQETLADITALQSRLLGNASASVRPGGKLVYSTCSFFVEENEAIISDFLTRHADFSLVTQQLHGNPASDADTMFSALLLRAERGAGEGSAA